MIEGFGLHSQRPEYSVIAGLQAMFTNVMLFVLLIHRGVFAIVEVWDFGLRVHGEAPTFVLCDLGELLTNHGGLFSGLYIS